MSEQGRYVSFLPKQPYIDPVAAEHVNRLQRLAERLQRQVFSAQDELFVSRMLWALAAHPQLNVLVLDVFSDTRRVDTARSIGVTFSEAEKGWTLEGSLREGWLYLAPYRSPKAAVLRSLWVMAEGYIPPGAVIAVELSIDAQVYRPLPLQSEDGPQGTMLFTPEPIDPPSSNVVWLRVHLSRVERGTSPRLDRLAFALFDQAHEPQWIFPVEVEEPAKPVYSHDELLDVRPDSHHPWPVRLEQDVTGVLGREHLPPELFALPPDGSTLLFRDSLGRLVKVQSPDDETNLIYDAETGRLATVVTFDGAVAFIERLFYDEAGLLVRSERTHLPADQVDLAALGNGGA